jgi:serine/threonine protein kinase
MRSLVTLSDFGSSVDVYSTIHLYRSGKPSKFDCTFQYAPPEVLINENHKIQPQLMFSYAFDMWSVGITFAEMLVGTANILQISSRTRAVIESKLRSLYGGSMKAKQLDTMIQQVLILQALKELCIFDDSKSDGGSDDENGNVDTNHDSRHRNRNGKKHDRNQTALCRDHGQDIFMRKLSTIDKSILKWNKSTFHLMRQLLQWHPNRRITAKEALKHDFFNQM